MQRIIRKKKTEIMRCDSFYLNNRCTASSSFPFILTLTLLLGLEATNVNPAERKPRLVPEDDENRNRWIFYLSRTAKN